MKRQATKKQVVGVSAVVAAVFAFAPTAQADTIVQSSSADLNLTDRTVLAAVNFYDPTPGDRNHPTVASIQGVDFDDFNIVVDDTGSPIALAAGTPGATLSTVINQGVGREFGSDPTLLGFSGPDATEAEKLAFGGAYFQDSETATLTFAFGGSYADTDVEIQMLGGGVWARTDRQGKLVMSVDSVELGELVDRGTPDLLTFLATTDNSGNLVIEVVNQNVDGSFGARQYTMLTGTIVTVAGSSPSFPLTITPNGANYDFSWERQDEKLYDLVSNTDLSIPRKDWPVYMGNADIAGSLPNPLANVPGDGTERYFAVVEKDPPPVTVFEENFEDESTLALLGWDTGAYPADTATTTWDLGTPSIVGPVPPGVPLPSASNCVGTNLAADYGFSSDIWLRTPPINLMSATGATLTFQHWVDIDPFVSGGVGDKGTVRVLDAGMLPTVSVLETLETDISGLLPAGWVEFSADFTVASLGKSVVLEFVFVSDDDDDNGAIDASGWYIDDVVVTTPAP